MQSTFYLNRSELCSWSFPGEIVILQIQRFQFWVALVSFTHFRHMPNGSIIHAMFISVLSDVNWSSNLCTVTIIDQSQQNEVHVMVVCRFSFYLRKHCWHWETLLGSFRTDCSHISQRSQSELPQTSSVFSTISTAEVLIQWAPDWHVGGMPM